MPISQPTWIRVATTASEWEAELIVGRLHSGDVPARARGNDIVGLFGLGFMGATSRGFYVEVPASCVEDARVILDADRGAADQDEEP